MHAVRRLVQTHHVLAGTLLALALVLRVIIPTGFMPMVDNGRFVITVCSGTGPMVMAAPPAMSHAMPHAMAAHDEPKPETEHRGADQPCAFAGLSMASLAAVDTVLLAIALLFMLALGLRGAAPIATAAAAYLRPPLRGPPTTA